MTDPDETVAAVRRPQAAESLGDVVRRQVHPADHTAHEPSARRNSQQVEGLGLGGDGLHDDRLGDPGRPRLRSEITDLEVGVDGGHRHRVDPRLRMPAPDPEVVMGVHGGRAGRVRAAHRPSQPPSTGITAPLT
jgi:hypothetical protein